MGRRGAASTAARMCQRPAGCIWTFNRRADSAFAQELLPGLTPQTVTILILGAVVMVGVGCSVWVLAPAFQGADAARRDLGSHRLEFCGWLTSLVLIGLVSVPAALILRVGPELTLNTFVLSALATDVPLLIFIYVRLIMPGALTWTELGLKPLQLGYMLTMGLGAGVAGLVVIGAIGSLLARVGLGTNQLEQFQI